MLQPSLFDFLRDLKANNDREWFKAHKRRYEIEVKEPCQALIEAIEDELTGPYEGSLFRIYRDTRFSADKSPYKTHAGVHFRHRAGKDAHAPGYYLHLEPGQVFFGAGVWHPDPPALARIREAIQAWPQRWKEARQDLQLMGEALKRAPKGIDPAHPLVEDLKRKDFAASESFSEKEAVRPDFAQVFLSFCRRTTPLTSFLVDALRPAG